MGGAALAGLPATGGALCAAAGGGVAGGATTGGGAVGAAAAWIAGGGVYPRVSAVFGARDGAGATAAGCSVVCAGASRTSLPAFALRAAMRSRMLCRSAPKLPRAPTGPATGDCIIGCTLGGAGGLPGAREGCWGAVRRGAACVAIGLAGLEIAAAGGVAGGVGALECSHHQPTTPETRIAATSHGKELRAGRAGLNGVARSGAAPSRRFASDFFRASRISDIYEDRVGGQRPIVACDTGAALTLPVRRAQTAFPARRCHRVLCHTRSAICARVLPA